jgi:hypothetical protein
MSRASLHAAVTALLVLFALVNQVNGQATAEVQVENAQAPQPWLDPDGKRLPFRFHAEVESFLSNARVVSSKRIGTGITDPRKLLLEKDGIRLHAIFKDIDRLRRGVERSHRKTYLNFRDYHLFECAAYQIDRLLGLNRVPPAVPRRIGATSGTLQLWMEQTIMEKERRDRNLSAPDPVRWLQQRQMMELFDNLLGNNDSNLGNLLIDRQWNLWFIDHTRCFVTANKPLYPERIIYVERSMWQALLSLDPKVLEAKLDPYLSAREIEALLARRSELIGYIQGLFAKYGEKLVLFDLRPESGEPYDWPD